MLAVSIVVGRLRDLGGTSEDEDIGFIVARNGALAKQATRQQTNRAHDELLIFLQTW